MEQIIQRRIEVDQCILTNKRSGSSQIHNPFGRRVVTGEIEPVCRVIRSTYHLFKGDTGFGNSSPLVCRKCVECTVCDKHLFDGEAFEYIAVPFKIPLVISQDS